MKKGVIYARYSSERQNEQSIDGQIKVCREWAENNDIEIMHIYHDEALSGKTDKRPDFQRMVKDAKSGKFEYVIVYKTDRFARNRYDSAVYKTQLKKYGARVVSAMENIADGSEGIILESVLEGMAEYYSANLAQNVLRGLHQRAEQGKHLGGKPPLGYTLDDGKNYVIDEKTAPTIRTIFKMYANGCSLKEIIKHLNDAGYKTAQGKNFTMSSFNRILRNEKYIGLYSAMGVERTDVIPPIIDMDTWEKVQKKIERNKHAPASNKSDVTFHLTGKLFCGKCNHNMVGDSGTGRNGTVHYYYSCIEKKKNHGCTKKSVRKEWLEELVTEITVKQVLTDENIAYLAEGAHNLYEKTRNDTSELAALQSTLKDVQKIIDNIMKAIEQGIITDTTKQHLFEAEERKKSLLVAIAKEEIKKPPLKKENIEFFLQDMRNRIYSAEDRTELIIQTFINSVYLYDDKLVLTFNLKDKNGLKKFTLNEIEKYTGGKRFGFDSLSSTTSKQALSFASIFFMPIYVSGIRRHCGIRNFKSILELLLYVEIFGYIYRYSTRSPLFCVQTVSPDF